MKTKYNKTIIIQAFLLTVVLLFAYVVFMYVDITNTIDNANILLRTIKQGRILDFYEISVEQARTNFSANYNFLIYIIFAIWQAPAYLAAHLLGKDYLLCSWTMLWSKTLILLFSMLAAYYIYKIIRFCDKDKKRAWLAVFLYFSSMTVFYPIFICGQLDVIAMCFMLGGLYNYMKGNYKIFWLCFLFAAPCKMFSILLALPLIILKEKNLIKAGIIWVSMTGLLIVEKIMFHASPTYHYALAAQSRDAIRSLLGANISLGQPITVFVACYMALLLYVYICRKYDKKMLVYLGFFLWGTFVAFSAINTYWIFLVAPFSIMAICVNDRFLKADILVETIGSFCYFLGISSGGTAIFRYNKLVQHLFLPKVMSIPESGQLKYGNLFTFFQMHQWTQYRPLFSTIYIAAVTALLILTFPKLQKNNYEEKLDNIVLFLRPLLLMAASVLIVYSYTARTNLVAYNTRKDSSNTIQQVNLVSDKKKCTITQKITFDKPRKLDELILKFKNTQYSRANMALLYVEIWDITEDNCIFKESIGCSGIEDKEDFRIDLKGTKVVSNHQYEIRLSGKSGGDCYLYGAEGDETKHKKAKLFPYFTKVQQKGIALVEINGKQGKGNLYFEMR